MRFVAALLFWLIAQLSSTMSIWRSRMNRSSVSIVDRPGWSGRPSARRRDRHHVGMQYYSMWVVSSDKPVDKP